MSAVPESLWQLLPMHSSRLDDVLDVEARAYAFPWSEGNFRDCLKAGYSAWVLTNDADTVVGYAVMSMAVGEAHLLNLAIDPALRGCGLGRRLLDHVLQVAAAAHCTVMFLEVRRSNRVALSMYRARGFERVGVRKAYYPGFSQREDAFVLALNL